MDDEFLDEFVMDANEHVSTLNESLLKLEKDPSDAEAINRIFRAAHTLKGNSATMGFMDISGLAHKMENVLDEVRQGKLELNEDIVDTLLEALDNLESMIEGISCKGPLKDCSSVLANLDSIISPPEDEKKVPGGLIPKTEEITPQSGSKIFKIKVVLSEKTILKSVRAFMVLKNLESLGKIIRGEPDIKKIEEGEFENKFTLYFNTDAASGEVEKRIKSVADVENIELDEEEIIDHMVSQFINKKESIPETEAPVKEIQSIRVGTNKLDNLVNLVGELIINKSRLSQISRDIDHEDLNNTISAFERLSRDLQDTALSMRMVKIAHVFDKFPRMVRDLAKKEGKEIEFILEGKEIELDRTVLDRLGDPLVHLLRNCVDHGIEIPGEREKARKPKKGRIRLSARRIKDQVEILIEDDGKGIDAKALREVAIKKGFFSPDQVEDLMEEELMDLIFKPGFSGAQKVTSVSGRGVGMDVVKTTVSKLGGSVHMTSTKGQGTRFILKLPLSLAIVKALLVNVEKETYAIPMKDVVEVLNLDSFEIKKVKGKEAIIHRGNPIPVLRLGKILNASNGGGVKDSEIIIVEKSNNKTGLVVKRILKQEEVVVKPLGEGLRNNKGISGATILGDGKVALILDVYNLV
jgi:two-component system chemotaxis sensor kinase CheA